MALIVNLKTVEYLPGKYDRIVRLTFRGHTYETNVVRSAKRVAYFGQKFEWPLARNLQHEETLTIQLFNYNKYLTSKLVGSYILIAQHLVQNGSLSICDPLVDANNRMLEATITFDVQYYSPDGKVGNWTTNADFTAPVAGDSTIIDIDENADAFNDEPMFLSTGDGTTGNLPGEDTASENVLLEKMFEGKKVRPELTDYELHRLKDFEVRVTILEAQQLAGLDIDPVIKIDIGEESRYTSIRQSTNSPYFNEYFVFDFRETAARVFDKIITISAYHAYGIPGRQMLKAGNVVAGKRLIGHFRCDLGTVFVAPDHQFYHKWAVLLDPRDTTAGAKGYVKCDLVVCERGVTVRPPKGVKEDETTNIEGNLLLPVGVPLQRQRAVYAITIYRAEDLPRTDLGILASVQKAITKKDIAFVDALVKVSFVGHIGKTSVIKSYNPEWKEVLNFTDMFPPLCNRIKIQLCDSDITSDETIATHFIELAQIMDPGGDTEGILPTFGPSWINLYGSPRQFKVVGNDDDLNEGIGEGSAFRGRVLLSIDTTIVDGELAGKSTVKCEKLLRNSGVMDCFPRRPFVLFATLFEASMIDKQLENKPIYFEISIGKFGNTLDQKSGKTIFEDSEDDDSDDDESSAGTKNPLLQRQKKEEAETCISHSVTEPRCMLPMDRHYGYLPIEAEKPCLYSIAMFEDFRKRLLHTNMLSRIYEALDEGLVDVKEMMKAEESLAYRRLKGVMEVLLDNCETYMTLSPSLQVGVGAGKTKLDRHRLKSCRSFIEKLRLMATNIRKSTTAQNVTDKYREAKEHARKLRHLVRDPQHALPDVILWMVCDKKRVAFHKFPAQELIFDTCDTLCGKFSGKRQTVFLKKPGKKGQGESGWAMQAKLDIYLWLGEHDTTTPHPYLTQLPAGYEPQFEDDDHAKPPVAVIYEDSYLFQLRAYMYQARSLIGCDDTGLSDPFARVIVSNYCKSTQVIEESLCPTWDETLIFNDIIVYGVRDDLIRSPPMVIIEFYDYDVVGQPEFLGRCTACPQVKLEEESYNPAQLDWFDIYRGTMKAGELLASFELLEGDEMLLPPRPEEKGFGRDKQCLYTIPPEIRPKMKKFRLEVLFRGVRELKKIQLATVTKPKVIVECAGVMITSVPLKNIEVNANFDSPLHKLDVFLPENQLFWPPLTIRCIECRTFGRQLLVGVCTVDRLEDYKWRDPTLPAIEQHTLSNGTLPRYATPLPTIMEYDVSRVPPDGSTAGVGAISTTDSITVDVPDVIRLHPESMNATPPGASPVPPGLSPVPADGTLQPMEVDHLSAGPGGDVTVVVQPGGMSVTGAKSVGQHTTKTAKASKTLNAAAQAKLEQQRQIDEKKERQKYRELITDCDWWSKYYVTKDDAVKEEKERLTNPGKRGQSDDDEVSVIDYGIAMVDYSNLNTAELEELQKRAKKAAADLEATADKKRKRKKKKKAKKPKKKHRSLKGVINDAFHKEEASDGEDDLDENVEHDDKGYIARFQYYNHELEQAKEFEGFEESFKTFPLFRGKKSMDDEEDDASRMSGYFKGNFCIYEIPEEDDATSDKRTTASEAGVKGDETEDELKAEEEEKKRMSKLKLYSTLPPNRPIEVKVYVYIVRALDLHPVDFNGKADPYLVVRCGRKKINAKENKIFNQLNPVFGRVFDFDIAFPMDSWLDIEVYDYDALSADDIIGSTTIDLENRFFSRHQARCGLQQRFEMFGYNTWRDPLKPTQILEKLCKDLSLQAPDYQPGYVKVADRCFSESEVVENEAGELLQTREHLALEVLKHWQDIPGGCQLVPEHIESRSLFCNERPGEQGKLELWIDMFPKDAPMPSVTIDITPRKPASYELRCIIWNTDEVTLDDENVLTGEKSSDIFVKGYVKGVGEDDQQTDVHYRSMTGEGNFNWRFVYPFEYLKAEEKIVYFKKESFLDANEQEYKVPPVLTLQIWDADLISADDFLGSVTLDLNRIPKPAKNPKKCTLKMLEGGIKVPCLDLFKNKRCKGWWPVAAREKDEESGEENLILKGKVEAELELLTTEEAEKTPVGLARKDPEALPAPNRPDSSFLWFLNPWKTLRYIFWRNYKWLIIKAFIVSALIAFIALFFYAMPGYIVQKIFNL